MAEEKLTNEKQDSISVSKNSKGHTWDIKIYFDADKRKASDVISSIQQIDEELKDTFDKAVLEKKE